MNAVLTTGALSDEFRSLFQTEFSYVCRSLRRLGVDEHDEEDLAQEVFLHVHRKIADRDRALPIRPWLFAFAARVASNYRRLAHRMHESTSFEVPQRSVEPADIETRDLVLRGLARLSEDQRSVLILHDLDGFSAPEVAVALEIPLNTVYSRLRVARLNLSAYLDELGGPSGVG